MLFSVAIRANQVALFRFCFQLLESIAPTTSRNPKQFVGRISMMKIQCSQWAIVSTSFAFASTLGFQPNDGISSAFCHSFRGAFHAPPSNRIAIFGWIVLCIPMLRTVQKYLRFHGGQGWTYTSGLPAFETECSVTELPAHEEALPPTSWRIYPLVMGHFTWMSVYSPYPVTSILTSSTIRNWTTSAFW